MLSSGRLLLQFYWANWLGLRDIKWQGFDSGYAYLIARIGVLGFAALWAALFSIPCENAQARLHRQLIALYLSAILCISYSPLTIKTASLLWFLFGATVPDAARRARAEAAAISA
jgi:putative polymerase